MVGKTNRFLANETPPSPKGNEVYTTFLGVALLKLGEGCPLVTCLDVPL